MAKQLPSSFSRYELSPSEQRESFLIPTLAVYMIQNLICDAAEEKLTLKYDPVNPLLFTQREAELQGQIGILKYILSSMEEVINQSRNTIQGE